MKTLKLFFKSLIKNDACIEGGRTKPWWLALIFFLVSTIISVIPLTVSVFTVDGGTVIQQSTFETDKGLDKILEFMAKDGVDIEFHNTNTNPEEFKDSSIKSYAKFIDNSSTNEFSKKVYSVEGKVTIYDNSTPTSEQPTETPSEQPTVQATNPNSVDSTVTEETVTLLKVYNFTDRGVEGDVNHFRHALELVLCGVEDDVIYDTDYDPDRHNKNYYVNSVSFIAFGKEEFAFYKYNYNAEVINATINEETGLKTISNSGGISGTYRDIKFKTLSEIKGENLQETTANAATFFRDGYNELKLNSAGIQLAIYLSINAGIVILMGFVLWLMTRGKNNPFNFYKVNECLKIGAWTSVTPALLALIFGFMMGNNSLGGFMFILTYGMRSMWLAMKNFKPTAQN